jgi:hypothetical protein
LQQGLIALLTLRIGFFMKKIELSKKELTLLEMGLRFLELHHPVNNPPMYDFKPDFRKLLDKIAKQNPL